MAVGHAYMTGHGWWNEGEGVAGTLTQRDYKDASQVVVTYNKTIRSGARDAEGNLPPEVWAEQSVSPVLSAFDGGGESRAVTLIVGGVPYEVSGLRVRRLTPRECERLQGFPDDWTLVPARTLKNGTVKWASDSARYKQAGNAVAVPVVQWIAQRLVAAEQRSQAA